MNPVEVVLGGVAIGVTIVAVVVLVLVIKDYRAKTGGKKPEN